MHGGMEALAPRSRVDVAVRLAAVHRREAMWRGRKNVADLVVALHDGGDRRELRRAAVVEGVGVDGEQRADPVGWADRHWSGDDCSDVTVQHRDAGGDRTPLGASLQPLLEFVERNGSWR